MKPKIIWMYGIWFVPGEDKDWLGQLYKEDGKWVFKYRFRYYSNRSTDLFDDKDRKSGYIVKAETRSEEDKQKLLSVIHQVVSAVEVEYGNEVDFIRLECSNDDPRMIAEMEKRSWCHVKMEATK